MDGIRKKAKYLHDAPDGALIPGVGGTYPPMAQEPAVVPLPQQYYTQPPTATYYAQNPQPAGVPSSQDGQPMRSFNGHQAPISPPYSQPQQNQVNQAPSVSNAVTQEPSAQVQPFGGLPFDPSDPALFNFDISGLNFGNHYGALEMGMLGHMSSGAAETPPNDVNSLNAMNQAAGLYNQMPYTDSATMNSSMAFAPDGTAADWQNPHSRHGSLQMQTPNNTPTTATLDHHHGHRQDSLHGPHAYAIGQGPSSISSASPASTDMNPGYDNDNPASTAAFFANAGQQRMHQGSPTVSRYQQENRAPNSALQPIQSNAMRKPRPKTDWIHAINKPYNYTGAFHRLFLNASKKYPAATFNKIRLAMSKYRPVFLTAASELDQNDLILQEKNLQRTLMSVEKFYSEVGVPSLVCRRSGEVVGMNKEFSILTGWDRDVLLGKSPNLNVNLGASRDLSTDSGLTTQTSSTPIMAGQEPDNGPVPVNIIELMDERSIVEWFEDFYELAYMNSRGIAERRVHMLRYKTKEDVEKMQKNTFANGKHTKPEPSIKLEGGPVHRGEAAMGMLGAKDGLVDCMMSWHIKRDNFDMSMLLCMHVSYMFLDLTSPVRMLTCDQVMPVMPFVNVLDRQV
jgi:hypothetical protein